MMAYAGGGTAAAAAAAFANAIKASGVLVKVSEADFSKILSKSEKPLVIVYHGGFIQKKYQYLTSYKGFAFFTKTAMSLMLPGNAEIINARQIWTPD